MPEMNAFCDQLKSISVQNQKAYRNREDEFGLAIGQTGGLLTLTKEIYEELKVAKNKTLEKQI